ncbi:MAG TPA: hypothetical protein PLL69_09825, partial [Gemmatimonadales bacterium]|nr:hypothetical protein [Gemmatimonadales bacterium]
MRGIRKLRPALLGGVPLTLAIWLLPSSSATAQDVSIDFGSPTEPAMNRTAVPDSVLRLALERFNHPATLRSYGGTQVNAPVAGSVGVHDGDARIASRVDGDVVVINGSLRLTALAVVTGRVIVLGGRFSPDPGARFNDPAIVYSERVAVRRSGDATLVPVATTATLRELADRVSFRHGNLAAAPRLGVGVYNRVEGMPVRLGGLVDWLPVPTLSMRLDGDLIFRTARDPGEARGGLGWRVRLTGQQPGSSGLSLGIEADDRVVATADHPLQPAEASINALIFRRDDRDWFRRKGVSIFGNWRASEQMSIGARVDITRERSLLANEVFSLLRSSEAWRPNPLIDDGRYTTLSVSAAWDGRDNPEETRDGWYLQAETRYTTSDELSPYQLPEVIRDPLPTSDYGALEASFDLRRYQRIDPIHSLHARFSGGGWLAGDPLTLQRRLALGGADFPAYPFRAISCDLRRGVDPATPALCDRRLLAQVELRRTFEPGLATSIGPYGIGIERADLIVFGDFGTAW